MLRHRKTTPVLRSAQPSSRSLRTVAAAAAALLWLGAGCSFRSLDALSTATVARDAGDATGSDGPPGVGPFDTAPGGDAVAPVDQTVQPPGVDMAPAVDLPADSPPPPPPDVAPPARPRVALVVSNKLMLNAGDTAIAQRMSERGLDVQPVDDDELMLFNPTGVALIFISKTAVTTDVGGRFRDTPLPVILSESLLYDDMGMVDASSTSTRGTLSAVRTMRVLAGSAGGLNPGLSGTVTFATVDVEVGWGIPAPSAFRVATLPESFEATMFGYDVGARMAGINAPARRVGLFLSTSSAAFLTPDGWRLFDAAVTWALGR
jgi:hypothetical protein